jgi:hypothetical protein
VPFEEKTMKTARVLSMMVVTFYLANIAVAGWVTSGDDMYSDVSGNVGIGTTAPAYRLHLVGKGPRDGIWLSASPAGTDVALLNNMPSGAFNGLVQANDSMVLLMSPEIDDPDSGGLVLGPWSAGQTGIRVTPTGKVGIGTYNPWKTLSIVGKSRYDGDGILLSTPGEGVTAVALLNNLGGEAMNRLVQAGDSMILLSPPEADYPKAGGLVLGPWSGSATGVRIAPTGKVGIGTSDPTEKLDVDGTARLRNMPSGGVGTTVAVDSDGRLLRFSSSRRYKTDIEPLADNAERVLDLQPVRFRWQSTGEADIGLIAEEVAEVMDNLVICDPEGRPDAVKYDRVALYLLSVVRAQQQQIEAAKAESQSLASRMESLERTIQRMQTPLPAIR